MRLVQVVTVAVALTTAGCWRDACVEPQVPTNLHVCHERLVSPLFEMATDGDAVDAVEFCQFGTFYGLQSCRDLGYTEECAPDLWVEPGIDCGVTGSFAP